MPFLISRSLISVSSVNVVDESPTLPPSPFQRHMLRFRFLLPSLFPLPCARPLPPFYRKSGPDLKDNFSFPSVSPRMMLGSFLPFVPAIEVHFFVHVTFLHIEVPPSNVLRQRKSRFFRDLCPGLITTFRPTSRVISFEIFYISPFRHSALSRLFPSH